MATIAGGSHAQRIRESEWYKWAVALTVSLGALMEVIDVSIVNVALPSMQSSMGATLSQIGWVITGYAMANVVIIPLGAWLSDRFGQRNYYLFTLVAFVASSVLCGLSTSLGMLVVARILQGLPHLHHGLGPEGIAHLRPVDGDFRHTGHLVVQDVRILGSACPAVLAHCHTFIYAAPGRSLFCVRCRKSSSAPATAAGTSSSRAWPAPGRPRQSTPGQSRRSFSASGA